MANEKIQDLIQNGYEFHTGEYVREGWDLFKKNAGSFIVYLFIYLIISVGLSLLKFMYLGQLISLVVGYPLVMGFYIVADKTKHGETVEFSDYFKGFNKILPLFLLYLLTALICVFALFTLPVIYLAVVNHGLSNMQDLLSSLQDGKTLAILLLLCLPGFYLALSYSFAPFFVYFKDISPWEAMETSRKLITKRWFAFFGFMIVLILIIILGAICLLVGLVVAVPVIFCAQYAAFNAIVGARDVPMENNLADHLIPA